MSTIFMIAIPLMLGSLWLNDWKTPDRPDKEYIQTYRILNATKMSDEEIIAEREEDRKSAETWKVSNKILADELTKRGIENKSTTAQYHLDQILFHSAYYNDGMTVEEFVDKQYKD